MDDRVEQRLGARAEGDGLHDLRHVVRVRVSDSIDWTSATTRSTPSRSALLTTNTSAIFDESRPVGCTAVARGRADEDDGG